MLGVINKGNWLPFYKKLEHQNRFLNNCNTCKWGLLVPKTHLLPWQVILPGLAGTISWSVVDLCDEAAPVSLSATLIQKECTQTETILTYPGSRIKDELFMNLPCGYHYIILDVDGTKYYSEVMRLDEVCGKEEAILVVDNCSEDPGVSFDFDVSAQDDLIFPVLSESIDIKLPGGSWASIGTDSGTASELVGSLDEIIELRRVVETKCDIYEVYYEITYAAGDPCGTYALVQV